MRQGAAGVRRLAPMLGALALAACAAGPGEDAGPPAATAEPEAQEPAPPVEVVAPPAPRETAAPEPFPPASLAEGLCTFDVREVPLDRTLRYVRDASGLAIPVAEALKDARVTLAVKKLPWRVALDEVDMAHPLHRLPEGRLVDRWQVGHAERPHLAHRSAADDIEEADERQDDADQPKDEEPDGCAAHAGPRRACVYRTLGPSQVQYRR